MLASTTPVSIDDLDLFADCTRAELRRIGSLTTSLRIPKGHVMIREGSFAKEFIVICSGTAQVTREAVDGEVLVADVGPGDFLGEMALLSGGRRSATVRATTDLVVLVSSVNEFRTIMQIAPSVAGKVHRASLARSTAPAVAAA